MRARERGLADAGRAHEAEHRACGAVRERLHREVLEDALLHFLEAVVVLVEDRFSASTMSRRSSSLVAPRERTIQSR
jgi:hypothetical protein